MSEAEAALAVKAAWWAAKRLAWCRALGDGSVDRGHFKVVMNEYRVARALDPGWQMESAGAGGGASDNNLENDAVQGGTRTRRRREARRRQREAAADEVELAKAPAAEDLERPTQAAPMTGLKHGVENAGGERREQARGGSTGGERGDAAQTGDAGQEKESEERVEARRALSKAGREKRDERDEQGKGHVATLAGAAVDAGRAGGKVQMGAARGYGAGEGVGGGVVGARTNGVQGESSTPPEQYKGVELEERRQAWIAYRKAREKEAREKGRVRGNWERDLWEVSMEMARERDLDKGKGEEYSKQYSGLASSTVQQASKSRLSGEVQSQAGTAPHRTGIGRQTYASAARKTSGGANQTTAGDGRRGM